MRGQIDGRMYFIELRMVRNEHDLKYVLANLIVPNGIYPHSLWKFYPTYDFANSDQGLKLCLKTDLSMLVIGSMFGHILS